MNLQRVMSLAFVWVLCCATVVVGAIAYHNKAVDSLARVSPEKTPASTPTSTPTQMATPTPTGTAIPSGEPLPTSPIKKPQIRLEQVGGAALDEGDSVKVVRLRARLISALEKAEAVDAVVQVRPGAGGPFVAADVKDFTFAPTDGRLRLTSDKPSADFEVRVVDDSDVDPGESIELVVAESPAFAIDGSRSFTIPIIDNERPMLNVRAVALDSGDRPKVEAKPDECSLVEGERVSLQVAWQGPAPPNADLRARITGSDVGKHFRLVSGAQAADAAGGDDRLEFSMSGAGPWDVSIASSGGRLIDGPREFQLEVSPPRQAGLGFPAVVRRIVLTDADVQGDLLIVMPATLDLSRNYISPDFARRMAGFEKFTEGGKLVTGGVLVVGKSPDTALVWRPWLDELQELKDFCAKPTNRLVDDPNNPDNVVSLLPIDILSCAMRSIDHVRMRLNHKPLRVVVIFVRARGLDAEKERPGLESRLRVPEQTSLGMVWVDFKDDQAWNDLIAPASTVPDDPAQIQSSAVRNAFATRIWRSRANEKATQDIHAQVNLESLVLPAGSAPPP